uniref:Uncharacterized protein n=1 Tax=Cannabis sativa TaxID=3483 RepID=A0A803P471_CANSA
MVNTRRTHVAPSTSSSLPQGPQITDPGTQVPITTRISMNTTNMVNLFTTIGATSLATTTCQTDTGTQVDPSGNSTPPRVDPTLAPPTEGRTQGQ